MTEVLPITVRVPAVTVTAARSPPACMTAAQGASKVARWWKWSRLRLRHYSLKFAGPILGPNR
jgi:hypothetical protein